MSNAAINPTDLTAALPRDNGHAVHNHNPHLAHHFDTPEQQFNSAKLGMWVFLGTEILMFGGLFCGYAVYRHNHPDVFEFAHQFLDRSLGAINTLVLITSSLTMAWAVRSSQLGHQTSLRWLMAVTILGGYLFLGIKSVEYHTKWHHTLFIGTHNQFREGYKGTAFIAQEEKEKAAESNPAGVGQSSQTPAPMSDPGHVSEGTTPALPSASLTKLVDVNNLLPADPNAGSADAAKIRPPFINNQGQVLHTAHKDKSEMVLSDLGTFDQQRLYTFFGVYFFMTGLHGVHVVIGMSLIAWVLIRALGPRHIPWAIPMIPGSIGLFLAVVGIIVGNNGVLIAGLIIAVLSVLWALIWAPMRRNRSAQGEFGPTYYTPVDLVGLYWHLVDLIWIFLFPLLYLIT